MKMVSLHILGVAECVDTLRKLFMQAGAHLFACDAFLLSLIFPVSLWASSFRLRCSFRAKLCHVDRMGQQLVVMPMSLPPPPCVFLRCLHRHRYVPSSCPYPHPPMCPLEVSLSSFGINS